MSKSVPVQVVCVGCGKTFRSTLRRNTTRCPHCGEPRYIPSLPVWEGSGSNSKAANHPALGRDPVEVHCQCGHSWLSRAASSQSVRCPKCHHSRRVPARIKAKQAPAKQAPARKTPAKQPPVRQVQAKRPAKQPAKQSLKRAFKQSITRVPTSQPPRQPVRQPPAQHDLGPARPTLAGQITQLLASLQKPTGALPAPAKAAPVPTTSVQGAVVQSLFPTRSAPITTPTMAPSANSTNALLEKFGPWSVSPHSARGQCAIQTATGHGAVRSGGCESVSTHVAHLGSKAAVPVCPSHAFALCAKADSTGLHLRLTPLVAGTLFGLPDRYTKG
jgi:Zn finger protein HypA/HybF involved in hydrogenase expression